MITPLPEPEDDSLWIQRVQQGDSGAFEPLLDRHLPCVRALVAMKLPVAHLVNEITHETFVFAFRHIREFAPGTSFRAWLRAIAWNLVRAEQQRFSREQRRQDRFAQARDAEWFRTTTEEHAPAPDAEFLEECLQRLPENLRTLLAMKYAEGRAAEEMAAVLDRSIAWVRVTLFRARQQLRACIEGKKQRSAHAP